MRRLRLLLFVALAALLSVPRETTAQFIPYYGKNKIKYDDFSWRVYRSPHFEVYYYPEFEQHLERLVSYLESGYLKISTGLKHEMSKPIPVIFYKTHSEFEETNLFPAFVPEGVLAFTEPIKNRMVIPIDEPPDQLQGLITHEMTHAFAFDLIPRGLGYGIQQRPIPLWIDEGLADYFRQTWDPTDLMMIRDAALTDKVPKLSKAEFEAFSGRLVYNMGHAAFEFMEARYGKEGIRQFLYTLRKGVLGSGTEELYKQAFRTSPQEFDAAFDKWLKERFKPFRDRQTPDDFGRDLSPDSDRTPFTQVFGFAPSPSGEIAAIITGNRNEGEADVVLISTKDGAIVRNLTGGFDNDWQNLTFNTEFAAGRTIAFDPSGDYVGFFARTGKRRSFFLVSVLDGSIKKKLRIPLDEVEAPCILPDGRGVLLSALKEGVSDIWKVDLRSGAVVNLTKDAYADNDPQVSPDGKLVVYERRISGHAKLYAFPLADPSKKTQLTFGAFDDTAPYFSSDGRKVYYSSLEDDDIPNLRSIDLETGAIDQYTDVFGGTLAPAALKTPKGADRLAFLTYQKGEFRLHTRDTTEPMKEVDQDVRAAAEGIVDFQPDVTHEIVTDKKRRKKLFEGLYLEGRPPINVGVTSNGDFFGGSSLALTDTLGDQDFSFTVLSVSSYRVYQGQYANLARRLHYGVNLFDQTYFFYPYSTTYSGYYGANIRDYAVATQRLSGGQLFAEYPFDVFRRVELGLGFLKVKEQYTDPAAQESVCASYATLNLPCFFNNGWQAPLSVRLVQETTRFAEFGPLSGSTFSLGFTYAPRIGSFLQRQTVDVDARKYFRLGPTSALLALRGRGFYSSGQNPDYFYFGGNMEMRGFQYGGFSGNEGFFANAELRLPLIHLAATPIGVIGPLRGTVYFGIGGAKFKGQDYHFSTKEPGYSYVSDPIFGEPVTGFRLQDGRASWGFGLQLFFLGYPMHFDWTKYTDFATTSKGWDFSFWVGYDF
jgi:hypothetical protein